MQNVKKKKSYFVQKAELINKETSLNLGDERKFPGVPMKLSAPLSDQVH